MNRIIATIITRLTLIVHAILSLFVSEKTLLAWKPIHLCWWFIKHGFDVPKYFIAGMPEPPTVTTSACSNTGWTSTDGNGNITATGTETPTVRGFCYLQGASGDPTTADSVVNESGSFGTGAYSLTITGLSPNTTYRVRAYATSADGTGYGTTVSVTTNSSPDVSDSITISENVAVELLQEVNVPPTQTATYYFDGSDLPAYDPDSYWGGVTNADDGDTGTLAFPGVPSSETTGYLEIQGTDSPAYSSNSIISVRARYHDGTGWQNYASLSSPTAGWSWQAVNSLETRAWSTGSTTRIAVYEDGQAGSTQLGITDFSGNGNLSRIEVEVTYESRPHDIIGLNIEDEYSESNQDTDRSIGIGSFQIGQSFNSGYGGKLLSVFLYVKHNGSPSGSHQLSLYAHSGTYGDGTPNTGLGPLAQSDAVTTSDLSSSYLWYEYVFPDPYDLDPDTAYFLYFSTGDSTVYWGTDQSSPTHGGNYAQNQGGWVAYTGEDACFRVNVLTGIKESVTVEIQSAGGALSIDVNDSVTVTESSTVLINTVYPTSSDSITVTDEPNTVEIFEPTRFIDVSDSVTITEDSTVLINQLYVSGNDSITLTEQVTVYEASYIDTNDEVTITEDTTTLINYLNIDVSDSVTLTEDVTVRLAEYIDVNDSITLTEDVSLLIPKLYSDNYDDITATDSPTVEIGTAPPRSVDVFSDATITEDVTVHIPQIYIESNESIAITEDDTVQVLGPDPNDIDVNDIVTITESVDVKLTSYLDVGDDITITESTNQYLTSFIDVEDTTILSEFVDARLTSYIDVNDGITITEDVTVTLGSVEDINVDVNDSVAITENSEVRPVSYVDVSESISITENSTTLISQLYVEANDQITVDDSPTVSVGDAPPLNIDVFDTTTITEDVTALIPTEYLSVSEIITNTEATTVTVNAPVTPEIDVSDDVTLTESVTVQIPVVAPRTIDVSDTLTLADDSTVIIPVIYPSSFEEITLSEDTSQNITSYISVSDAITITELNDQTRNGARDVDNYDDVIVVDSPTVSLTDNPQVDVYDDISLTENTALTSSSYLTSSESITVTDNSTVQVNTFVDASESIIITESVEGSLTSYIDQNDEITLSESVTALIPTEYIDVSDSITTSESSGVLIPTIPVEVSDDITVTESSTADIKIYVDQYDSVTMTDELPYYHPEEITVTDDSTTVIVGTKSIDESDDITVTENTTLFITNVGPVASEDITVTESTTQSLTSYVDVFDGVTLSEDVTVEIGAVAAIEIDVSDTVTNTDTPTVALGDVGANNIDVYDDVTVTENVDILIPTLYVSASDEVTLSESDTELLTSYIDQSDDITISENTTTQLQQLHINVNDGITLTESVSLALLLIISQYDDVAVSEDVSLQQAGTLNINVYDYIGEEPETVYMDDSGRLGYKAHRYYHIRI